MEEKEVSIFSLTALLLVTGFCFLSFALALKILDGVTNKLFIWTGIICLASGVLTSLCIFIDKKQNSH